MPLLLRCLPCENRSTKMNIVVLLLLLILRSFKGVPNSWLVMFGHRREWSWQLQKDKWKRQRNVSAAAINMMKIWSGILKHEKLRINRKAARYNLFDQWSPNLSWAQKRMRRTGKLLGPRSPRIAICQVVWSGPGDLGRGKVDEGYAIPVRTGRFFDAIWLATASTSPVFFFERESPVRFFFGNRTCSSAPKRRFKLVQENRWPVIQFLEPPWPKLLSILFGLNLGFWSDHLKTQLLWLRCRTWEIPCLYGLPQISSPRLRARRGYSIGPTVSLMVLFNKKS